MRYVPVERKIRRQDSAPYEDVYLDHSWTYRTRGLAGFENVRVSRAGSSPPQWDYYSVFYMVPVTPGMPANRSLRRLTACPPFTGEFIIIRRSDNGQHVLNMRFSDRDNADAAVTTYVFCNSSDHNTNNFSCPRSLASSTRFWVSPQAPTAVAFSTSNVSKEMCRVLILYTQRLK